MTSSDGHGTGGAPRASEAEPPSGERLRNLDPGPLSNEPQMESHAHVMQLVMFLTSLLHAWRARTDFFATGNMSIYYPVLEPGTDRTVRRKLRFRGPDFFVVLDPLQKPERNSWVVENEAGKYPDVIVEVLSRRTRSADRGQKKEIYERIFRTPEYFLFDPIKSTLEGYRLVRGRYKPISPDAFGHLPSTRLGLALGLREAPELGGRRMARLFTPQGELVPLPPEVAERETARADREASRAEQEASRAQREAARADRETARAEREATRARRAEREKEALLAKLRALGIDPGPGDET